MKITETYKFVREKSPLGDYRNCTFVGFFISSRISPFFTQFFIRNKIIPNKITILMILSGLISSIFFLTNNVYCQIISLFFINLWFIFDCSDGEVARITKNFSKYGKELDFIAHLINHPLMILSFSYVSYLNSKNITLSLILIAICILDLIIRNTMTISLVINQNTKQTNSNRVGLIKYIIANFYITPNFVIFFPLLYIVDVVFKTNISFIYSVFTLTIMLCAVCKNLIRIIGELYNS